MDLASGARIGRYELISELGTGASGTVWEAVLHGPRGFRKDVALKLLRLRVAASGASLDVEAKLGARIAHPNVVAVLDLGEAEGCWFIAMELVRGASLAHLAARGPLPPAAALDAAIQTCAGLAAVHRVGRGHRTPPRGDGAETWRELRPDAEATVGLVHRDVKPGNLLVDRFGQVKVADLGLARVAGAPGLRAGTPGYAPPEQLRGSEDRRADLFALGATLFELVTGRAPFGTGPAALVAVQDAEARLDEPHFFAPVDAVAPGLAPLLRRCLRADPDDRWPSADALAQALAALRGVLPPGSTLRELVAGTLPPAVAVPPHTAPRGALPAPDGRFFGRREERARVEAQVRSGARMITLLGPGGMGKTRLALAVARAVQGDLPGGAWFVDLTSARTAGALTTAAAGVLGVGACGDATPAQLARAIAARGRALFVLDNLEHVAEDAAATLRVWLERAPEATFVCTSRRALRVRAEDRVVLGPLAPADALALFLDRAVSDLTETDRADAEALVEALEGMPLAIELAAARTRMASIASLRQRLGDRLRLLAGGGPDLPERHRSVRTALAGSWEQLGEAARGALAQLSVFEAPLTLEAAEAVLDTSGLPGAPWAMDVLTELVDASLLAVELPGHRFRLLDLVRRFAAEHLTPEGRAAAEIRHGRFFAQLGSPEAMAALDGPGGAAATRRVQLSRDDLVAATRRAIARNDVDVAFHAVIATWAGSRFAGPISVGRELLRTVARMPALDTVQRVVMAHRVALVEARAGSPTGARATLERSVQFWRDRGDAAREAGALLDLGIVLRDVDPAVSHAIMREALVTGQRLGIPRVEAIALEDLGAALRREGRLDAARDRYLKGLDVAERAGLWRVGAVLAGQLGQVDMARGELEAARVWFEREHTAYEAADDLWDVPLVLGNLGHVAEADGDLEEARLLLERGLALARQVGNVRSEGILRSNLAEILMAGGGVPHEAIEHARIGIDLHRELGRHRSEGLALVVLGTAQSHEGEHTAADQTLRQARELGEKTDDPLVRFLALIATTAAAVAGSDLPAAERTVAEAASLRSRVPENLHVGLHCARVRVAHARGNAERAASALADADRGATRSGIRPGSLLGRELERVRSLALSTPTPP